jgi:transcriptional regulator with XRE-family HTH domain
MEPIFEIPFKHDDLITPGGKRIYLEKIDPLLDQAKFSKFISEKMKVLKLNQKKAASAIGISPNDISDFLRMKRKPSYPQYHKICKWIDLHVMFFILPDRVLENLSLFRHIPTYGEAYLQMLLSDYKP